MCGTVSSLAYSTAQPCVLSLRCYRVSRRNGRAPLRRRASAPSPHPLPRFSFTNPKHRFGFDRKNEEADMEFSAFAGNGMQRVHSDAGKKWGNKLDLHCATHDTSSVTLRVPPSPQGEGFKRNAPPHPPDASLNTQKSTPHSAECFFPDLIPQVTRARRETPAPRRPRCGPSRPPDRSSPPCRRWKSAQ